MNKLWIVLGLASLALGCTSMGVSIGLPIPGGSISVGGTSDGRVSGGVVVGSGGVSVGVGGSGRIPKKDEPTPPADPPQSPASAPAPR
jgi:hypothetical protein